MNRHGTGARIAALVVLLCGGASAHAGSMYLQQVVKSGGVMGQPPIEITQNIWMSDQVICIQDAANNVVTRFELASDKLFIINTRDKQYAETTKEQMQALATMGMEMLKQLGGGDKEIEVTVSQTGAKKKIGEWNAYEVATDVSGPMPIKMTTWLSEDVPVDMGAWKQLADAMPTQGMLGDAVQKMSELKGYPVLSQTEMSMMGMKVTSSTTLTAARAEAINETVCSIKPDYKKTEGLMMPGMPGSAPQ